VACCGVNGCAVAAVEGDACPREAVQRFAQPRARPADVPQGLQVVLAAVRTRLVSRPELLAQPHDCDMPLGRLCQTTTRPQPRERAVQGQRQQSSRVRGRPVAASGTGISDTSGSIFRFVRIAVYLNSRSFLS
jgi:hypothetical protein